MKKLFTLFVSLWMAMASLFAANITANTVIYFDATAYPNIQTSIASGKTLQMLLGHSSWSQGYKMTAVEGYDNIYSVKMPQWDGCTQLAFCTVDSQWGGEGSSVTNRLNWTYEKTAVHSISSNLSGNVGFAGSPLTRTNNYTLPVKAPVIKVGAAPEFATTTVGETANATVTYTLENATEATATIEGEGFSIAEQSVGSVTITFAPEAEGEYTGTLTITSGDVKETVAVKATAVAPEAPKVPEILHVSAAEFAEIMEGETTSVTVIYELVNAEEATATVEGEGFAITAQETGSVTIEFAPATAGEYTGKLIIAAGEVVKEVALAATAKKAPVIVTIGFVNPDWTEAAIWAWIEGGANLTGGVWPGKLMTKGENGKFTYELEIPEDGNYKFIINNNNKGVQSNDLPGVTESTCYVIETMTNNKFTVAVSESCEYQAPVEPDPIDPYVAIRGTMTNWDMANDIKMTFNETANEWSITKFAIEAGGKFKVVSVNEKSESDWYGSDKVELQDGLTNAGQGDGDIDLGAGTYDIYFKVAEGKIWIQKYVEPTPEPDPIDPYAAIRGLGEGTEEEAWSEAQQIKLELNAEAESEEWFIQGLEIAEGQAFKVVYVNAKSETAWYGATAVEANEELGTIGEDNITLAAGKYDIYFKVATGTMWIAPVKAVEPEPEPLPIVITFEDEVEFPKTYVGETTNDIINFTIENAPEDAEVNITVTGDDAFSIAEIQDGYVFLAFAPQAEGEYAGVLTITVGEVSESLEFTAIASPVEVDPEPAELEFALVGRLNGDNDNEILAFEDGYKFTKESEFVYTLNVTFTGAIESGDKLIQKVKLVDAEGNIWARNSSKTIKPSDGTSTMTKGETASSTYLVTEVGVEYKITYTLVSDPAEALYKLSGQITFEKVETPVDPEPDPDPTPEYPKTITVKVACAWEACNIWAWYADGSGNVYTEWPGEAMTKGEDGFYAIDMTIESPVYFKVNAGLGKTESENYMTELSESTCFNMNGLALVVNEDCEYEDPIEIEPYYGIRGLVSWEMADDIKLTEDTDKAEWYITNVEVDGTQEFKVVYVDKTGAATWFGSEAVELQEGVVNNGTDNIILAAGKYDIYFKANESMMWIQFSAETPTGVEETAAELIYAVDGTIFAPAPFAIIDLSGKDVTNANGSLQGTYIVKTQNSTAKISVK